MTMLAEEPRKHPMVVNGVTGHLSRVDQYRLIYLTDDEVIELEDGTVNERIQAGANRGFSLDVVIAPATGWLAGDA